MLRFINLLLFSCALACTSYATVIANDSTVIVNDSSGETLIGNRLFLLRLPHETDIHQAMNASGYMALHKEVPNLGINSYSVWLKFQIYNNSAYRSMILRLAYPLLDEVALYVTDSGRVTRLYEPSFFSQARMHPAYLFDLNLPPGTRNTYYLRIKSAEQIIVPISVTHPAGVLQAMSRESLVVGIYMGIILIMVAYNFFLYLSIRDRSYIYYVIYIFFMGLTQAGIEGYFPARFNAHIKSTQLFACLSGIAALLFSLRYLQVKRYLPRARFLFLFFISVFVLSFFMPFAGFTQKGFQLMQLNTMVASIFVFAVSFYIMIKGYSPAKFFFIAWSILLTGSVIFILKDYGMLPYNTLTHYAVEIASSIETALLSFGLADRINQLKKEKEASRALALRVAQENESIIKRQNALLEIKVQERTEQLHRNNEELNKAFKDLKEAQTQLISAEKMASLGQLTAGIAHEINNPINFVAANVKPLERDIRQLLETIEQIEAIHETDVSPELKQQQIASFKEEQDLDYTITEINYLLKGIHEGASRTASIVKSLRTFSRLDEDSLKAADLEEGIESTLIIVNNLLKDIKVEKNWGGIPEVICYPGKINQVFLNIISNAIYAIHRKFGDKPGGKLTIETSCDNRNVFISIRDNGIGMAEDVKKRIFEPFFTTKEVGEGTGLGMSIAFNIIKKHEGDIYIESEPGEGCTFRLSLPLQQA